MPVGLTIGSAGQLKRVSAALKKHGDKELSKELTRGITAAVKPLKKDVKTSARTVLPKRGGLAKRVGRGTLQHKTRKTGRSAGVRIIAKPNTVNDPRRIDRGRIKHPVFGRGPWVLQDVKKGYFTKPLTDGRQVVRKELVKVMKDIAKKIERAA